MYDENRPTANIESYCKREECWTNVAKQNYTLSEDGYGVLITPAEKQEESVRAKRIKELPQGLKMNWEYSEREVTIGKASQKREKVKMF